MNQPVKLHWIIYLYWTIFIVYVIGLLIGYCHGIVIDTAFKFILFIEWIIEIVHFTNYYNTYYHDEYIDMLKRGNFKEQITYSPICGDVKLASNQKRFRWFLWSLLIWFVTFVILTLFQII